jgi:hypothetical protein
VPILKLHGSIQDPDSLIATIDKTSAGLHDNVRRALDEVLRASPPPLTWVWIGCSMRDRDMNSWLGGRGAEAFDEWWIDPLPGPSLDEFVNLHPRRAVDSDPTNPRRSANRRQRRRLPERSGRPGGPLLTKTWSVRHQGGSRTGRKQSSMEMPEQIGIIGVSRMQRQLYERTPHQLDRPRPDRGNPTVMRSAAWATSATVSETDRPACDGGLCSWDVGDSVYVEAYENLDVNAGCTRYTPGPVSSARTRSAGRSRPDRPSDRESRTRSV